MFTHLGPFDARRGRGQHFNTGEGSGSGGTGDGGTGDGAGTGSGSGRDATYWQAEAQKAFKARDELKGKLRDLEGRVLSDDDRKRFDELTQQAERAEEERKKKAGEFDTWRTQLTEKSAKDLKAEQEKTAAALAQAQAREKDLHDTLIGLAFAGAADWFGDSGKTVLPPSIAQSHLARYVEVQTDETTGARTVIVKNAQGTPILDTKTGQPMEFGKAIGELIDSLPEKERILRGSGKAGSGSSGGSTYGTGPLDLETLTRKASQGDANAIAALRNRRAAGGMVQGTAWEKQQRAAR